MYSEGLVYDKQKVFSYWEDFLNKNDSKSCKELLAIFNKYGSVEDIEYKKDHLVKLFDNNLPENLIIMRSLKDFLKKLLEFVKGTNNLATTYNILEKIITALTNVKYLNGEMDIIKEILIEFQNQGNESNAKLIARQISKTSGLKFYITEFKDFLD